MYTRWGCVVALLLITLLIQGCSWGKEERNEQFYGHFITLDKAKWGEGEEYFFAVPVDEGDEGEYRVIGLFRVTPQYILEELAVGVLRESPAHAFEKQIVKIPTPREARRGYNLYEVEFVITERALLGEHGVYTYSFQQLMSDQIVEGVIELGLIVEKL